MRGRRRIVQAAEEVGKRVLGRGGAAGMAHLLIRHYAEGIEELAGLVDSDHREGRARNMQTSAVPFAFGQVEKTAAEGTDEAEGAILLDFGNYTIGSLVEDRRNYDFQHSEYIRVRRHIEARVIDLGYAQSRFGTIDRTIEQESWRRDRLNRGKVERYGKKYGWIAYYEMYAWRRAKGLLSDFRRETPTPEVDIDPSFPQREKRWTPPLRDVFAAAPREGLSWASCGVMPEYDHLLYRSEVDGEIGPWVLLDGFLNEEATEDERSVFSFIRGILVSEDDVHELCRQFKAIDYPGNDAIPDGAADHYTYDGEIPWSRRFGNWLRDWRGQTRPDERRILDSWNAPQEGVDGELPVYRCVWESYHSEFNPGRSIVVPAPALCSSLGLARGTGDGDLLSRSGSLASLYRECDDAHGAVEGHTAYLRADLLAAYLESRRRVLVWLVGGERCLKGGPFPLGAGNLQIHRHFRLFCPERKNPVGRRRTRRRRPESTRR